MKRIELAELKKIQLEILDRLHEFCTENDIHYWLDNGTLLGAIRHKGYIPWDDDIDVGMLRPDFDKFMQLFNDKNTRYKCYSVENNEKFGYPFGKLLDTETVLYEPDEKGMKSCVNIDIFVYDNAPEDDKIVDKMYKKRDIYRAMNNIRVFHVLRHDRFSGRLIKKILNVLLLPFPRYYFTKKMAKNATLYRDAETSRIGNFTSITRILCDKSLVSESVDVEFEGKTYKAPIGYDEWLRAFYGDYMQLPPEEKRVPHHVFKAYKKEEEER